MVVPLDVVIRLRKSRNVSEDGGTAFDLDFMKHRSKRGADTNAFAAKLAGGRWEVEASTEDMLDRIVEMVKSLDYPTDTAMAKDLNLNKSQIGRWRDKAIAAGKITQGEWENCRRMAKGEAPGGAGFDDAPESAAETSADSEALPF